MTQPIYDIAIIGGGIAGAGIARDASLRGARVIVFEKNTAGSGTSSKSSKLIHGGLRYLETAWHALRRLSFKEFWKNTRFVFLALRETHILHRSAPELIHPIPLLIPIYKGSGRNPLAVYFGTFLYGLLSRVAGGEHFSTLLPSKNAVLKKVPALNPDRLLGGVVVWDHTTDDLALVRAVLGAAENNGTKILEHAKVMGFSYDSENQFYKITFSYRHREAAEGSRGDLQFKNGDCFVAQTAPRNDDEGCVIYARKLINAAGPWVDEVRRLENHKAAPMMVPVAGAHIQVKKFSDYSIILEAEDKRVFFVINQGAQARIGTTERPHLQDPDHVEATHEEVDYLLRSLQKFFPSLSFSQKDILRSDTGIRPLAKPPQNLKASDISREHEFVMGESGVIHVLGVKLTDHRRAAEELMDKIAPEIKTRNPAVSLRSKTRDPLM